MCSTSKKEVIDMAVSPKQIEILINECQRKLDSANSGIDHLETELRDLQGQRKNLELEIARIGAEMLAYAKIIEFEKETLREGKANLDLPGKLRSSQFPISEKWEVILRHFSKENRMPFSIDDIMDFVAEQTFEISRNAIRSQLSSYFHKGILKRPKYGKYQLTNTGMQILGVGMKVLDIDS